MDRKLDYAATTVASDYRDLFGVLRAAATINAPVEGEA
jgi:hypothetical protein